MLRAGLEPATSRLGVDNRSRSGPQQKRRRGRGVRSDSGFEPQRPRRARSTSEITESLRPATRVESRPARGRTRTDEVGAHRAASYTTGLCESGRPGSNGPLRGGAPVLFLLSYVRVRYARLESNQHRLPSRGSALSVELRACEE